jgi:GT2 family glycosyltransferase
VDFCKRAVENGFSIQYVPEVTARHLGGHSVADLPRSRRSTYWCVSLLRYVAKHFRSVEYRATCVAVVLSSVPRMFAEMLREQSLAPILEHWKIACFAGLCLVSTRRRGVGKVPNS